MNKYMIRGLVLTALGILIGLLGSQLQAEEYNVYKWILIVAVLVFGVGFLTIVYSLIRKIERKSIIEDREEQLEKALSEDRVSNSEQVGALDKEQQEKSTENESKNSDLNKDQGPDENS